LYAGEEPESLVLLQTDPDPLHAWAPLPFSPRWSQAFPTHGEFHLSEIRVKRGHSDNGVKIFQQGRRGKSPAELLCSAGQIEILEQAVCNLKDLYLVVVT